MEQHASQHIGGSALSGACSMRSIIVGYKGRLVNWM